MSKLPGKWKDVPVKKIINWLGHPANVIDDNDETVLDRCKRVKELNHFVKNSGMMRLKRQNIFLSVKLLVVLA